MAGGFVLCDYEEVRTEFPEFKATMMTLRKQLIAKAMLDWSPLKFAGIGGAGAEAQKGANAILAMEEPPSGMAPKSGEFGESPIMPAAFRTGTNSSPAATTFTGTWEQIIGFGGNTGHQTIMSGANTGVIYEDYKIGLVGIAFLDKAIRIAEIRMQISDKKLPRINVEEAMAYNKPAIIFEEGYILDEETGFDLYAFVLSEGIQNIKLIGLELNRIPNKLQVTDTGAALT